MAPMDHFEFEYRILQRQLILRLECRRPGHRHPIDPVTGVPHLRPTLYGEPERNEEDVIVEVQRVGGPSRDTWLGMIFSQRIPWLRRVLEMYPGPAPSSGPAEPPVGQN